MLLESIRSWMLMMRMTFHPAERLLSHAKVGEDVLKCFLGGDALFARDFCKVVDDDAEILGKEVAT